MMENGREAVRNSQNEHSTPQTPEILITTAAALVMAVIVYLTMFDGHVFF